MRDILIAARDCQGIWPRHPAHDARIRGMKSSCNRYFAFGSMLSKNELEKPSDDLVEHLSLAEGRYIGLVRGKAYDLTSEVRRMVSNS